MARLCAKKGRTARQEWPQMGCVGAIDSAGLESEQCRWVDTSQGWPGEAHRWEGWRMHFLHWRKSGIFYGVGDEAAAIARRIAA